MCPVFIYVPVSETLQLGIWSLDGDPAQSHLLKFALNEPSVWHTMLLICVSLTDPWSIMNELQMWLRIVQQHVVRLNLAPGEMKALRDSIETQFRSYAEPVRAEKSKASADGSEEQSSVAHNTTAQIIRRGSHCITLRDDQTGWPYTPLHPMEPSTEDPGEGQEDAHEKSVDAGKGNPLGVPIIIVVTKVGRFRIRNSHSTKGQFA
ncbi:unnamed protein product [Echinostoma caproni]|uniref:Dynein light intermediate chain n=1 Tax=Echinostoma caproni TaxID=27848 RepID=A0A183BAW6_9TREM|nr:unnamed protein product [Echinostoma caproni]